MSGSTPRLSMPWVVALTVAAGALLSLLVLALGAPAPISAPVWVLPLLLLAAVVGELAYVRLRHGDSTEDLTFFEAVVIVAVCLLPTHLALAVPLVALVVASVLLRRPFVKMLFNLGSYAAATSALILIYHLAPIGPDGFSIASALAVLAGTLAFAALNMLALTAVLVSVGAGSFTPLVRASLRLSALMAVGNASLGLSATALALFQPVLLLTTALPALALFYAYSIVAHDTEERERTARLLELSSSLATLAEPQDLISRFLALTSAAFRVPSTYIVIEDPALLGMLGLPLQRHRFELPASSPAATATEGDSLTDPAPTPSAERPAIDRAGLLATPAPDAAAASSVAAAPGLVGPGALGPESSPALAVALLGERLSGFLALPNPAPPSLRQRFSRGGAGLDRGRAPRLGPGDLAVLSSLAASLVAALERARFIDRLTEESVKLATVLEHASDGIVVLDERFRVLIWNEALEHISGTAAPVAFGRPLLEVLSSSAPALDALGARIHPDALTPSLPALTAPAQPGPTGFTPPAPPPRTELGDQMLILGAALSQLTPEAPRAELEVALVRPDGEQRLLRAALSALFEPDPLGTPQLSQVVLIAHDMTSQRRTERLKMDFIATVSHELKTPLTPILGYAQMLLRRSESMDAPLRTKALEVIKDRAEHLSALVEDLLLTSRITSDSHTSNHSVSLSVLDLAALASRALEDFAQLRDRVVLEAPEPVWVRADPVRALQCVGNLLSNAAKYSPPDSPVRVRILAPNNPEGFPQLVAFARIEVSDAGRGIPASELPKVFEKFHRVDDALTMTTGGTGLGLFIARELARAMGGDLAAISTLGVGSTFALALAPAPASEIPRESAHRYQLSADSPLRATSELVLDSAAERAGAVSEAGLTPHLANNSDVFSSDSGARKEALSTARARRLARKGEPVVPSDQPDHTPAPEPGASGVALEFATLVTEGE